MSRWEVEKRRDEGAPNGVCTTLMSTCECEYLPEKYHTTYYGATEPGSMQEYNPWCPEHGHLTEQEQV